MVSQSARSTPCHSTPCPAPTVRPAKNREQTPPLGVGQALPPANTILPGTHRALGAARHSALQEPPIFAARGGSPRGLSLRATCSMARSPTFSPTVFLSSLALSQRSLHCYIPKSSRGSTIPPCVSLRSPFPLRPPARWGVAPHPRQPRSVFPALSQRSLRLCVEESHSTPSHPIPFGCDSAALRLCNEDARLCLQHPPLTPTQRVGPSEPSSAIRTNWLRVRTPVF